MKKFTHHIKHYTPLFGLLLAALLGFWLFRYDRFFQIALTIASATGYVFWGFVHHTLHKDLTLQIIVEYMVIAFLGVILAFSVILRA